MNLNSLIDKLEGFFDLSEKKQRKKHDNLLRIINKLENKKSRLKQEIQKESAKNKSGDVPRKLCREFKVVTKLLKKAKKHDEQD